MKSLLILFAIVAVVAAFPELERERRGVIAAPALAAVPLAPTIALAAPKIAPAIALAPAPKLLAAPAVVAAPGPWKAW
ncbi:cuticle protein 16.5-like isoform X1 [Apis laboriosa]|uniref:cuticle protein 16.5-like isoform X1 n=1 Tax=Apis dorsata TaxID=7462 RepID=UPI0003DF4D6D|nr:cuticle protein 16.5-like isoform X1 [Apis dorsata]XP_043801353.1 cuticle protein 16.5-like isoform X1 [Apis laboriosa]